MGKALEVSGEAVFAPAHAGTADAGGAEERMEAAERTEAGLANGCQQISALKFSSLRFSLTACLWRALPSASVSSNSGLGWTVAG
jgi:hypothetical protein